MAYVTLQAAKDHLLVTDDYSNGDVDSKIEMATAIVADYLKSGADETWDEATTPGVVQAATLLVVGHLHRHRGEDMGTDDALWKAIERLLMRYRDPAFA